MADDSQSFDVSSLLAPWMAQSPWDMSQYGGQGQFGAQMLAAAGPTTYRQPFLAGLGKGMLAGQQQALQSAQQRMGLGLNSLSLQRQMAMMPFILRAMQRLGGQGGAAPVPSGSPAGSVTVGQPGSSDVSAPDSGNALPAPQGSAPAQSGGVSGAAPAPSAAPWMSGGGMDPMEESQTGALFSLGGVQGGEALQKDAAFRAANDPNLVTQRALASGPIAQDMMLLNAAAEGRNPAMSRMALTKLQTDMGVNHIGSMSGIRTYQEADGSWSTDNPSTGLHVNSRTGASYMPGALQAFAAREAAEKGAATRAELSAETSPGGAGGGGGGGGPPSAPAAPAPAPASAPARAGRAVTAAPAPQGQLTGLQAITSPNYVPPILTQAGSVPQRPGSTSLEGLKVLQQGQAEEANKTVTEMQEKASNGQTLLAQTAQIRSAASEFPWTGRFADDRGSFLSVLQGVGWVTPEQAKELAAYQDASKISIQLQASATKQLGSREAAQVFGTMGKSIPNLTLSPMGLDMVSSYMEGVARYNQAMSIYGQRLRDQGNAAAVNEVENTFIAHSNPSFFILASSSPQSRAAFLKSMPQAKRTQFIQQWNEAANQGLAPRPADYQGQ